ncbi:hypothetical protein A176_001661 [Myxococcus hansupus]|uniref:Fungal lipase-type domain-containing protein n=1 Tax=Pseudomyxococcus hansupus TaxID=1297742 RepID=A0A0H4WPP8_9BACT|nr:hypothetical protein [Myxococcus hansupus]AKQ64749.1 hypothetical protein A176_001661 [Myxococcus hansupus]
MPNTTPALNLYQKTYLLTRKSNLLGEAKGDTKTLAKQLQTMLTDYLALPEVQKAMEGQWSVVWGPAVFEAEESATSYADNVMYVAASPDESVYVVAIAGTNMKSSYDENEEDNGVNTTKFWTEAFPSLAPYGAPLGFHPWPAISTGTALGVNNLLGMTDTLKTQQSLRDFLHSRSGTGSKTLIFGGHSLGGALAPTLALALFNPGGGPLNLRSWGHVHVLPVAGPTPGNKGFSEFFQKVFPPLSTNEPQNHYAWNQNIWNSLDAVPHAWVVDMLKQIPTLYDPQWASGHAPLEITLAVDAAVVASEVGGLVPGPYTQLPNIEVPGKLQGTVTNKDEFFEEVGYQHVVAYDIMFGIQALVALGAQSGLQKNVQRWWNSLSRMAPQDASRAATGR